MQEIERQDKSTSLNLKSIAMMAITTAILVAAIYFATESYSNWLQKDAEESVKQASNSRDTSEGKQEEAKAPEQDSDPIEYVQLKEAYAITQIDGQYNLLDYPEKVEKDSPLKIVIYSHGSTTFVTNNLEDPFIKQLIEYGDFFTKNGYVFVASNQHGESWGNTNSLNDMQESIDYILADTGFENYELYLLGYSMGGLPTLNYATKEPSKIKAIALLAPTIRNFDWNKSRIEIISTIPVKIWHGTEDVNVLHLNTLEFLEITDSYGLTNIELKSIEGLGHWSIDGFYNDEILNFYNSNR